MKKKNFYTDGTCYDDIFALMRVRFLMYRAEAGIMTM